MKNIFLSFSIIFISTFLFGQERNWQGGGNMKGMMEKMKAGRLYGKVVDSTSNKGVEFASVQLIGSEFDTLTKTMKKNVIMGGQLTLENGDFSIDKINVMGKYRLKVKALGYEEVEFPVSFDLDMDKMKSGGAMSMLNAVDRDLGNIKISMNATKLKDVEIIGTAPAFELKLDKKIFNVEKNFGTAGGTGEDVLKQVPSVSVDMDGKVTLRNATPQIFVDGKPTTLTIDQIPAEAIESVEVITNPSAKYEASGGQGGILNIVLKKEKRIGYNGNVRAGIDQRGKGNIGGDFNIREGKLNAFLSGNVNQRYSITKGNTDRFNYFGNPLTNIYQDNYSVRDGLFLHSRGGVDWFMNNRNTLTFSGNIVSGRFDPVDDLKAQTDTLLPSSINTTTYHRISETGRKFTNNGGTIQYKHIYPKAGRELTADINYNKSSFTNWGDYSTKYYNASGNQFGSTILQNMAGSGYTEIYSAQTDYVHPINDKTKWETGVRGSYRNFLTKNDNFLKNDSTGEFEIIKNQSTNYKFNDQVYAAYLIFSKQINKFSFQTGLRSESSLYIGELIDSNKTFKNSFPASFFPSASSTYEFNEKNNIQLSYSRRINRPTFFQLIPFTDYSDSLNLKRGNPALKPEFTHSLELSYLKIFNKQNNVLVSGFFKTSSNLITDYQFNEYDTLLGKNVIMSTFENANASYVYGGEFTSKHSIKKWLEFTVNVNAYYSVLDAKNIEANLTNEQFSWFTKWNFTIKFPKNLTLQITADYKSKTAVPVNTGYSGHGWSGGNTANSQGFNEAKYEVSAALKYEFLKNKAASLNLRVNDIFASDISATTTESAYFYQTSSRIRDPQIFRLTFSYRFGKFDTSLFKRKNTKMNMEGMELGM